MAKELPRWKIVVFRRNKETGKLERIEKTVRDPKKGQEKVKELAERGIKSHIVCRRFPKFAPKGEPEDDDQLWCPYCRRWRYFAVPKKREPFTSLEIRCCKWCWISEDDAYVKTFNGTWEGRRSRRKRGKKNRNRKKGLRR